MANLLGPMIKPSPHSYHPNGYAFVAMSFLLALASCLFGWSHVPVICALFSLAGLVIAQWQALLVIGYSVYGLLGALISVWMIERGAYISEQFRYGSDIGAANVLSLVCILFWSFAHISVVLLTRNFYGANSSPRTRKLSNVTLVLLISSVIVYALMLLMVGSAWNMAGARFELMETLPGWFSPVAKLFRYYLVPAAFAAVGMCLAIRGWTYMQRGIVVVLSSLIFIMQFLLGDKLSGFIVIATFVAVGYGLMSIWKGETIHFSPKYVALICSLAVVGIGIAALGYAAAGKQNVWESIAERLVLQGHIWYGIYEISNPFEGFLSAGDLLTETYGNLPGGLDALSLFVAPADFVWTRIAVGIGFTMGGSAATVASMGIVPGVMMYTLMACSYGAVSWLVMIAMNRGRWYFAIGLTTYFFILAQITQMGNWYFIMHPVALLCYFGAIVLLLLPPAQKGTLKYLSKEIVERKMV